VFLSTSPRQRAAPALLGIVLERRVRLRCRDERPQRDTPLHPMNGGLQATAAMRRGCCGSGTPSLRPRDQRAEQVSRDAAGLEQVAPARNPPAALVRYGPRASFGKNLRKPVDALNWHGHQKERVTSGGRWTPTTDACDSLRRRSASARSSSRPSPGGHSRQARRS